MIIEARGKMTFDEVSQKSAEICGKLVGLPEFGSVRVVMAYMDFRNEVMTGGIIRECMIRGKRAVLPVIVKTGDAADGLRPYEPGGLKEGLRSNAYGIMEPDPQSARQVDISEIGMVLVPGVVFDACRHRIGYGGGYYDGFLKKLAAGCLKIGLSFEMQIVENIPAESHDTMLDMIITEKRII